VQVLTYQPGVVAWGLHFPNLFFFGGDRRLNANGVGGINPFHLGA